MTNTRTRTAEHPEDGSATVSMAMTVGVALLLIGVIVLWVHGTIHLGRAQRAADLAALAAADAHRGLTSFAPCSIAGQVAQRNGAQLETCQLGNGTARVSVRVLWLRGEARAGDPRLLFDHGQ